MYSYIGKNIKTKKIYFLIHNAKPHQNFPFQKFLIKYMLQHATHLVVMNENEKQIIKSYNLNSEIIISFHPIYEIDFNINDRAQFKKELGVKSEPTILFFGLIRKYKGLDVLIKAVKDLKSHIPNIKVFVVGEPYTDMNFYLSQIKKYDLESSFILDLNFVNKERLKKYFLSSELIILPYKRGTQSGILSLSMNFNLPSIVTSRGGLKDYVIDKETGFIVNPDASEIATSIKSFFDKNMFNEMSRSISIHKKNFSWEEFEKNLKLND
jgi:glycosyltransferase involved in cell wall biosynthesis